MNESNNELQELSLEKLVPFSLCHGQTYQGDRLEQLKNSIEKNGLLSAIIVRPLDNGTYEIICGHNRVKAMKELGYTTISADIRGGLSDEEALGIYYDSNLNQQSFSDWNYTQKFKAIRYTDKQIRLHSQQGKRNDLKKVDTDENNLTSVQTRQKSGAASKPTTRDKMACQLGISAATFSKYRRIIKLPENIVDTIARLLDQKKLTFEAAYVISGLREEDADYFVNYVDQQPAGKINLSILKAESKKKKNKNPNSVIPMHDIYEHHHQLESAFEHTFVISPMRRL